MRIWGYFIKNRNYEGMVSGLGEMGNYKNVDGLGGIHRANELSSCKA